MRLLFGSDPCALETHCLAEIHQRTIDFPEERAFLIVPEQNKVQMERSYLNTTGVEGLLMAEVLSFRRLAHRLLDETGLLSDGRVDAFGRRMLLFRVLKEQSGQLHSFAHLADRSGFIAEVEAVIGDLKRHRISAAQLRLVADSNAEKALADKCHDLSILLEGYDQALFGQALTDADDDLNRLAELLDTLALLPRNQNDVLPFPYSHLFDLKKTHIFVCGFGFIRDFTPQEYRILEALSHLCASLTVSVQADAFPTSDSAVEMGPDPFLIGRRTLHRLSTRITPAEPVRVDPDQSMLQRRIAQVMISSGMTRMPKLATQADTKNIRSVPLAPAALTLIRLPVAADEIDLMAGEIRQLTQTGAYRFQDIAVALCEPTSALPLLQAASRRYNLPFFLDDTRSLAGTVLLRFMLGLFDLSLRNWSRDAVMTVLRSGLTSLDSTFIDLLENDLLQRGLFRRDRLFAFASCASSPSVADQRIQHAVKIVFQPMRCLTDGLRTAADAAECGRLIRAFFTDQHLNERIETVADRLKEQGEPDAALMLISAHSVLGQVLQQLDTIAGDVQMSLTQLRDTIRSGLVDASVTLIPSALDQIMVGDWHRISRQACSVLFVIGARMDVLPPKLAPEGLLKDLDRQFLSELLQIRLPSSARDQAFADAGSLYQLLTRPTDLLYLGSSGGEPAEVADLLSREIIEQRILISDDLTDIWNPRMNSASAALHRIALLSGSAVPLTMQNAASWRELARQIVIWQTSGDRTLLAELTSDVVDQDSQLLSGVISPDVVMQLYAPLPSMSVSQLEMYAACPFSHLAAYIFRLQERAVYTPESTDTGTLLHGVVEMAIRELSAQLACVEMKPDMQQAILNAFANIDFAVLSEKLMNQTIVREGILVMNDPGIRSSIGRKLKRMAASSLQAIADQLEAGGFLPQHLEWCFGPDEAASYAIALSGNRSLSLRGKVDRIDLRQENGQLLFRVIDYKSGDKTVDPDALYHGLALQLPTYLSAYSANRPEAIAEQAAYFRFDWPVLRPEKANEDPSIITKNIRKKFELRTTGLAQEDIQLLQQHTLRKMVDLSEQLFSGQFTISPRKFPGCEAACRYCPFSAVCGFNRKDYYYLRPISQLLRIPGESLTKKKVLCRLMAMESDQEASQ